MPWECGLQKSTEREKSLRRRRVKALQRAKKTWTRNCRCGFMGVFGDDFAAVDLGEDLCQPTPHEKANRRGLYIV